MEWHDQAATLYGHHVPADYAQTMYDVIAPIARKHRPDMTRDLFGPVQCRDCMQAWPCEVARIVQAIEAVRFEDLAALANRLRDEGIVTHGTTTQAPE